MSVCKSCGQPMPAPGCEICEAVYENIINYHDGPEYVVCCECDHQWPMDDCRLDVASPKPRYICEMCDGDGQH